MKTVSFKSGNARTKRCSASRAKTSSLRLGQRTAPLCLKQLEPTVTSPFQGLLMELVQEHTEVNSKAAYLKQIFDQTNHGGVSVSEMFTIGGTGAGKPCMFPFMYRNQWYSDCTMTDRSELWCAVQTQYGSDSERWGFCPTSCKYVGSVVLMLW